MPKVFHKKKKVNIVNILGVGVLYAFFAQIVHTIGAWIGMNYYMDPTYAAVWSQFMMPGTGAPPASFYFISLIFGILTGILFALVYHVIKDSIPVKNKDEKGILYGLLVFLVSGLPGSMAMFLTINLPLPLIALWAVEGWVIALIGGILVAEVIK